MLEYSEGVTRWIIDTKTPLEWIISIFYSTVGLPYQKKYYKFQNEESVEESRDKY